MPRSVITLAFDDDGLLGLFCTYMELQGHSDFRRWLHRKELLENHVHIHVEVNELDGVIAVTTGEDTSE